MKKGFTLIELLAVIAIIAILTAIIFPVFARAKNSAYRSSDMSNMNSLRTELQLYRADQEAYPPVLLGYVNAYGSNGTNGVIPANLLVGALYPKLVGSIDTFRPALDRSTFSASNINVSVRQAMWPNKLNDTQRFGPADGPVLGCWAGQTLPNIYYTLSGYDVANVPQTTTNPPGASEFEIHYTLFWSNLAAPLDPCKPDVNGSASDTPRQLGYFDPPDNTVVTWDSYFRDPLVNGSLPTNKGDIVLFAGGAAEPYSSAVIGSQSWQAMP